MYREDWRWGVEGWKRETKEIKEKINIRKRTILPKIYSVFFFFLLGVLYFKKKKKVPFFICLITIDFRKINAETAEKK